MAMTKNFDCIKFKREAQEKIYQKIKGMTPAEEIAWFRSKVESGPYGDLWKRITAKECKTEPLHCAESAADYKEK
jgi:hypothetical protein